MYSRQESSQIKKEFWTRFGQYMKPIQGAAGHTINWLNYKTGIRQIYFRMDADTRHAAIGIELHQNDVAVREQFFQKFIEMKSLLEEETGEKWHWQQEAKDEHGNRYSRIYKELSGVNLFNEKDWPAIISFLKPRILALDSFWTAVKPVFE